MSERLEKINEEFAKFLDELDHAERKHKVWPKDMLHQGMIFAEEAGEALKAINEHVCEYRPLDNVKKELRQTGAMCLRILINLEDS